MVRQLVEAGSVHDLELSLTRKDGSALDCLYSGVIIEVQSQKKLLSIGQDITDLKRNQRALQRSEERFALAMRGSNDGVFDWDLKTNEVYYSPRWKFMLGYEVHELDNHFSTWERLVEPQDRERSWAMMRSYMAGEHDNFETEFQMRHKDGHWVDILSRAFLLRDASGMPARLVGTHVDISERLRAQRQIEAERNRAERYLAVAGVLFVALDTEGRVTLVNPKGCELLGLDEQEIVGRN